MNCDELHTLRDAYLDSELDPKTSLEIAVHLNTCAPCAQAFEAVRAFGSRLDSALRAGQKTPALWDRLEAQALDALRDAVAGAQHQPDRQPQRPHSGRSAARVGGSWLALLWPAPRFYVGLAALWMVLLAADWGSRDRTASASATPASGRSLAPALAVAPGDRRDRGAGGLRSNAALAERRREIAAILAALDGAYDEPAALPPRSQAPGRRMAG
jgi:anti-sigma factor RsiW